MRGPQIQRTLHARRLRRTSTDAEAKLWQKLRARQIEGFKFVRQEPIGPYVADFVCREACLVIEVDGGQNAESARDKVRDDWLAEEGYRVLRFWNNDVLSNMSGVLEVIGSVLSEQSAEPLTPTLSP